MARIRKRHTAAFKAKVAFDAAKTNKTAAELAKTYQVHTVQIGQWKRQLLDGMESIFADASTRKDERDAEALLNDLYQQIGRLNVELEWAKKTRPALLAPSGRSSTMNIP